MIGAGKEVRKTNSNTDPLRKEKNKTLILTNNNHKTQEYFSHGIHMKAEYDYKISV